jgi:hypothetical protein
MGSVGVLVTAVRKEDEAVLDKAIGEQAQAAIQKAVADGTVKRFLQRQALRRPAPSAPRTQITLLDPQDKPSGTVGEPAVWFLYRRRRRRPRRR